MTHDAFEQRLRETLARRGSIAASPALRDRVLGVATSPVRRTFGGRWERVGATLILAAAAVAIIAFLIRPLAPLSSAITGAPNATPVVGIHPGDGLLSPGFHLETLLLAAIVIAAIIGAARQVISKAIPGWLRGSIVVGLVVLAVVAGRLSTSTGLGSQGSYTPGLGYDTSTATAAHASRFLPGSRSPFSFGLAVWNDGSLPLTLKGLARPDAPQYQLALVAAGSYGAPGIWDGSMSADPTVLRPFEPVTLWPGDEAFIGVLGMTGDCVAGPGAATDGGLEIDDLPLVVDILGFEWVDHVRMDQGIELGSLRPCTGQGTGADPIAIP
jgi:hypothetical protein